MEDVVKLGAKKMNYLKEEVDFTDELFYWVAKEYYRRRGYLPESWKRYMEDKINYAKQLRLATK